MEQLGSKLEKTETQPHVSPSFRPHLQDRIPSRKVGVAFQRFLFCGCSLTKCKKGRRAYLAKELFLALLREKCPLRNSA